MPGFSINTKKYGHFNKKLPSQLHSVLLATRVPFYYSPHGIIFFLSEWRIKTIHAVCGNATDE